MPSLYVYITTIQCKSGRIVKKIKIFIKNVLEWVQKEAARMLHVTDIEYSNPDSREEHLPGYTAQFPHICSLVDGADFRMNGAPWHWHESAELFYIRRGSILYRTPHTEQVLHGGQGGFINSNVLHTTTYRTKDLLLVLHLFSPSLVAGIPGARSSSALSARWPPTRDTSLFPLAPMIPHRQKSCAVLMKACAWMKRLSAMRCGCRPC